MGIDLGGTKIAGVALGADGRALRRAPHAGAARRLRRHRRSRGRNGAPRSSRRRAAAAASASACPGRWSPASGLAQNANSTWLNGQPFQRDLEAQLGRPVRLANDANCFALSEAVDGAAAGARSVFGVILGTGCGGGLVFDGALIDGPRGIGGEWGHNPLPWAESPTSTRAPSAGADASGCIETWVSGPGLEADHARATGSRLSAEEIAARAAGGDAAAQATLDRHASRLARGLAHVVNIFDPEVIVLGGGLSKLAHLYAVLPDLMAPYVLAAHASVVVKPPVWGDAGGVRGAAWLWG